MDKIQLRKFIRNINELRSILKEDKEIIFRRYYEVFAIYTDDHGKYDYSQGIYSSIRLARNRAKRVAKAENCKVIICLKLDFSSNLEYESYDPSN